MLELTGVYRSKPWGGKHFFPLKFGAKNINDSIGEYVVDDSIFNSAKLADGSLLCDWIEKNPTVTLGNKILSKFGHNLPFSLVLRDVSTPLILQDEQRNEGGSLTKIFELLTISANRRIAYSIDGVYIAQGFRSEASIINDLNRVPELAHFTSVLQENGLQALISQIERESEYQTRIASIVAKYQSRFINHELSKNEPIYWFMKMSLDYFEQYQRYNKYLLLIFTLNIVYIPRSEALYIESRCVFIYLEGQHLEVSSKCTDHVDNRYPLSGNMKPQILKLEYQSMFPQIMCGNAISNCGREFSVIGEDILVSYYELKAGQSMQVLPSDNVAIWLHYSGELRLDSQQYFSTPGSTFYQRANEFITIHALSNVTLFKASTNIE